MESAPPRVQVPSHVAAGEVFEVRAIIGHAMETGLRHDPAGATIPRLLLHRFTCTYDDSVVFRAELHESVAANPFLSFFVRAGASGVLRFTWEEDGGAVFTLQSPLTVRA